MQDEMIVVSGNSSSAEVPEKEPETTLINRLRNHGMNKITNGGDWSVMIID